MKIKKFIILASVISILWAIYGCKDSNTIQSIQQDDSVLLNKKYENSKGLFNFIDPKYSNVNFVNQVSDDLVNNIHFYEYSFNGGGVAIGDINNDGLDDILFTSTIGLNRLYLNEGKLKFKDITNDTDLNTSRGVNVGVTMVDINNDGWLDIYICRSGNLPDPNTRKNQLFINNKNLTFTESAEAYGLADMSYSTQAYFFDCDLDGDLDMYLVNHPIGWGRQNSVNFNTDANGNYSISEDTIRTYVSDRLYINENGKFKDKTKQYGLENLTFGLSAVIADFNGDNYPDIYVANDYVQPDQFYINKNGKGFVNEANKYFKNMATTSMGSDVFDANNDGLLDIYVNDMMSSNMQELKQQRSFVDYDAHQLAKKFGYNNQLRYNSFQIKNHAGLFSNIGPLSNTIKTDWSWAVLGEDYDNNGHIDLFITNGYFKNLNDADYASFVVDSIRKNTSKEKFFEVWNKTVPSLPSNNFFFANNGSLEFDNVSSIWKSAFNNLSNGAAYADLDNDGDLDLVVNNINEMAFIMENTLNQRSSFEYFTLQLNQNNFNVFAVGSEVTAYFDDGELLHKIFHPTRGYLSSCSYKINFTVPAGKKITHWVVKWPDGKQEKFENLKPNTIVSISKGSGTPFKKPEVVFDVTFEKQILDWKHIENNFIDFKREPLLHMKHSVSGPVTLVSDFDGDGLDDIYLGGAMGQASIVMFQKNGEWIKKIQPDFEENSKYEDVAVVSIDFDNDGQKDIIVASGGYERPKGDKLYELRAYKNDKGTFKRVKDILPEIFINSASLAVGDLNNDGFMDLILGGGAIPNEYPNGEGGIILINNKGKFKDATNTFLPQLKKAEIIKDIAITDVNGDGFNDIIICGDFQPIRIFINQNGKKFVDESENSLPKSTHGMWQRIYVTDINNDGQNDFIVGNLGKNTILKASENQPTSIYLDDFDDNDELDPILTSFSNGKQEVVHSRDRLLSHMTKFRKKYLRYRDYAKQSLSDIFGSKVKSAKVFNSFNHETAIFINNKGSFTKSNLPLNSQLSITSGITSINHKENNFLVTAGNFWDTDYDYGIYDASCGAVYSTKNGVLNQAKHNLDACGNIRNINKIIINGNDCILVAINNESPVIYCPKK